MEWLRFTAVLKCIDGPVVSSAPGAEVRLDGKFLFKVPGNYESLVRRRESSPTCAPLNRLRSSVVITGTRAHFSKVHRLKILRESPPHGPIRIQVEA